MQLEHQPARFKLISLRPQYRFPVSMHGLIEQASYSRFDRNPELLQRIERLGYAGVKVPLDVDFSTREEGFLQFLKQEKIPTAAFTCLSFFMTKEFASVPWQRFAHIEVFLDRLDERALGMATNLLKYKNVVFSLVCHRQVEATSDPLLKFFENLPKIHLYFPYPSEPEKGWSTRKVFKFTERLQKKDLLHKAGPPLSPLRDSRSVHDTREEYFWEPNVDTTRASSPKFSVIIPCYNNYPYLKKTLLNLAQQRLPSNDFEILVVDDGSEKSQAISFFSWIKDFSENGLQLKYTYSPRLSPRAMGDGRYRAGISRNLGVSQARGEILCFLDSDILVPDTYLSEVEQKLMKYDVIQCRRYDLSAAASEHRAAYSEIDFGSDVIFEDEYWDSFHQDTKDWSQLADGWKYTCTHSLSLRTTAFKDCGWILPCFIYYGFEDTELGYRLWNRQMKFHLSETKVFHLYHKPDRSEFLREKWKRDRILSKTAEIFFRHQPHPHIYRMFEGLLR